MPPGQVVPSTQAQRFHAVQYIELSHAQAGDTVDLDRALQGCGIEPAAAARAARGRAELMAALGQMLADIIEQLGRKRPGADARGVGLGDAQHVMQRVRTDTRAGSGTTGSAVGGSDERISAMINVE